jgi:molecular chaperone DnaJ
MPEPAVDYYKVLGVRRDASEKQIQKAYRTWVRRTHPDHHPDPDSVPFGAPDIILINEAWSVLGDPDRRAAYDRTLDPAPLSQSASLAASLPTTPLASSCIRG